MRYAALRTTTGWSRRWPVTRPGDYPAGHVGAHRVARRAAGYFYLNRGWTRTGHLFSHVRPHWAAGWVVQVFYVDRRRGRPVRRCRRGRVAWLVRRGRRPYLGAAASVWPTARWVWCRLPGLFEGNLDTVVAHLRYRLRGRFERRAKSVALPLLKLTQRLPGVRGAHVRCHGRFTRRQRADRAAWRWGTLDRTHLGARVEDARVGASLRFGRVGVTLLVNYGG